MTLNPVESNLHLRAVALGRSHRQLESRLVKVMQEVDGRRLWLKFDCTSLFQYVVSRLGLSEPVAYAFIAVARKAAKVAPLQDAVAGSRISVATAARIVACLTAENAAELIEFATTHTNRETDCEVAQRNPKVVEGDRVKPTSEGRIRISVAVSSETYQNLRRVESLEAQRGNGGGLEQALEAAADEYLVHRDPVQKAARADVRRQKRESEIKVCANRVEPTGRVRLTAEQRHGVFLRDGGRCVHVGHSGKRCGADRWIDVHHVHPETRAGFPAPPDVSLDGAASAGPV